MEHINHFPEEYDSDPHFTIDPDTRVLQYDSTEKLTIIQGDHNSEIFTFDLPRYVDGHDMTQCDLVRVHYINVDSNNNSNRSPGVYNVKDLQVSSDDENIVVCSWAVSKKATKYAGTLSFLIQFACTDGKKITYSWHTSVYNDVIITKGMDNAETESETYTDILHDWYLELLGEGQSSLMSVVNARDEAIGEVQKAKDDAVADFISRASRYGGVEISTEPPTGELTILWFNPDDSTLSVRNSETNTFEPLTILQGDLSYITDKLGDSKNLVISQKVVTQYINALIRDNGVINADILLIKEKLDDIKTYGDKVDLYRGHVNRLETDIINHKVDMTDRFNKFSEGIEERVAGMENIRDNLNREYLDVKTKVSTILDSDIPMSSIVSRMINVESNYYKKAQFDDFFQNVFNPYIDLIINAHSTVTNLQPFIDTINDRSMKNESDIKNLSDRMSVAETFFNENIDFNALDAQVNDNRLTIQSFSEWSRWADDTITSLSNSMSEASGKISSLETDLADYLTRFTAMETLIADANMEAYEDRLSYVEDCISSQDTTIAQLRNDLNALRQMVQGYHPAQ